MVTESNRAARSILIVEDDPTTRDELVKVLTLLGYYTVPVATVAEGVAKLDGQHYAIIKLGLPDGLGTVVLERIRAENRPIRVAVILDGTDVALFKQAESFYPELILRKPLNLTEVLEWVGKPN